MNYRIKRIRAGLSSYQVAKELGIDWKKYEDVEKRKLNLEGDLLNKFLGILGNAKALRFNHKQTMVDIKKFIEDGNLKKLMADRGYNGLALARVLKVDPSVVSQVLNNKYTGDDMIEYIYDFLQNPINANTTNEVKVEKPLPNQNRKYNEMVEKLRDIKNKYHLINKDIAEKVGISISHFDKIIGGYVTMTSRTFDLINDFITKYENGEISFEKEPKTPTLKETAEILTNEAQNKSVVEETQETNTNTLEEAETSSNELEELKNANMQLLIEIQRLNNKLYEAQRQITLYEKLIMHL